MMGRRSLTVGDGAVELSFRSVSGDLRVVDPLEARGRIRDASTGQAMAAPPTPPTPPVPSTPPTGLPAPETGVDDDRRLEILRALERGEIDIDAARAQLALLDESTDA
jgi:hypothetical protein